MWSQAKVFPNWFVQCYHCPSIILTTYRLNPISAVLQWKNTLNSSPVCRRVNRKTGTIHTHACWVNRCKHVFGPWQEAGVPENNPCMHSENMQSAQRKTPAIQEVQGGQHYPLYQGVIVVLTEKTRMWPVYQILSQSIQGVFLRSLKQNHKCQSCGSKRAEDHQSQGISILSGTAVQLIKYHSPKSPQIHPICMSNAKDIRKLI